MEKIAIVTIATGKYISLFENLKSTIFDKFLVDHEKTIFLYTDCDYPETINVKVKKILHLPWPLNTILRFNYFNTVIDELKQYDLIYYMDSDIIVNDLIDDEIIPKHNEIIAVQHYWYENLIGTYETKNEKSTAYVDENNLSVGQYCQACFFGAKTIDFIKMNSTLNKNVIQDFKNNTIAIWHDESHLNKYLLNVPCKRLHSGYAHPSVYDNILNKNIVKLLHKNSNGII